MNQFIVVRVNTNRQYRVVYETVDGRNVIEARTESRDACNENNDYKNPHTFYFVPDAKSASDLAAILAYWNPGTSWHWFKVAGIAETRKPGDKPNIKEITEKGFLPKDFE